MPTLSSVSSPHSYLPLRAHTLSLPSGFPLHPYGPKRTKHQSHGIPFPWWHGVSSPLEPFGILVSWAMRHEEHERMESSSKFRRFLSLTEIQRLVVRLCKSMKRYIWLGWQKSSETNRTNRWKSADQERVFSLHSTESDGVMNSQSSVLSWYSVVDFREIVVSPEVSNIPKHSRVQIGNLKSMFLFIKRSGISSFRNRLYTSSWIRKCKDHFCQSSFRLSL